MKRIEYSVYLDKVYGCFLGKAISGNIGAPHEGVKMPLDLPFLPQMINPDMPNDDLDLQVLWLDVMEQKGADFTSADLLERFVNNCDYSPGEYAVMRKNYERGIMPPYSGRFCNDYYIEGMGCPIRSEVWACVAVGNPELADVFSQKDGCIDHYGESINAERFLAVLECNAFFEFDIKKLITDSLKILPDTSKFKKLVLQVVKDCEIYNDYKKVFENVLFNYGHPDCTNMYQNMGITILSLLLGDMDIIKSTMMALNCGFDTDCTCATVGAILGIIKGSKELADAYGVDNPTYKLGVTSDRPSEFIKDLAVDISKMGVEFTKNVNKNVEIINAPDVKYSFDKKNDFTFTVDYCDTPSIGLGGKCNVIVNVQNNTTENHNLKAEIIAPNGIVCLTQNIEFCVEASSMSEQTLEFELPWNVDYVFDKNIIKISFTDENNNNYNTSFGICGATPFKVLGPYWKTEPVCTTKDILDNFDLEKPYKGIMANSKTEGNRTDKTRQFHLNFAVDTKTDYAANSLFTPPEKDRVVSLHQDSFTMDDLFGFKGPCAAYLSRIIDCEQDQTVFLQIGYSSPFSLYLNDKLIAQKDDFDNWTAENVHIYDVNLKKGENNLVLRMTRANADAKYNVTFSLAPTCSTHVVGLKSKNPLKW